MRSAGQSVRATRPHGDAARSGARRHLRVVPAAPRTARERSAAARKDLRMLWASGGFLTAVGLIMVLSAGSVSAAQGYDGNPFWYFQRQVVYAAVGIGAAVSCARMRPRSWRAASIPLLGVSGVLMLVAALPGSGTSLYGASRWLDLGPVTLQPSEFAKLGLVAFTATILSAKWDRLGDIRHVLLPLGPVLAVVAGLGIAQRDLGTTVILCATVFVMLFMAGVRLRYLLLGGAIGLAGTVSLIVGETYRRTRFFDAWLDPWKDPSSTGYQLIQGLIAFGSGGWFGTGLGTSRAKWDFLPNAHSDFIFAVIGEELGLAGSLVILAAFGLLMFAGIRISIHATGTFERLLAGGIVVWIGLQTIINLGAVTGLLPITGVPLPLVSFGGTALVVTLGGIGVLASVAREPLRKSAGRTRAPKARS
ncbi:MAG: putative lipid II flippase FtsW [Actinomycetota bacterium]